MRRGCYAVASASFQYLWALTPTCILLYLVPHPLQLATRTFLAKQDISRDYINTVRVHPRSSQSRSSQMSRIHSRRKPLVFLVLLVSFILIHYYTSSPSTGTSRFGFDISSFSSQGGSPYSPGRGLFPFFNRPTTQTQFPLEAWPSAFPEKDTMQPEEWNEKVLEDLERCRAEGNCRENQGKVALFASNQWIGGFVSASANNDTTSASRLELA